MTKLIKKTTSKKPINKSPYKEVDSSSADLFRTLLPVPDNVAQMAAKTLFKDARMSNASLEDKQKVILWDTIKNAQKRSGKINGGGTEYQDYGGQGNGTPDEYNQWFNKGGVGKFSGIYNSLTNPGFKLASTIGRGRYWQDPKNPGVVEYTDVYDWNASEKNFKGKNLYQNVRNLVRKGEDTNLNADKNENYRMNFRLRQSEVDSIRNGL